SERPAAPAPRAGTETRSGSRSASTLQARVHAHDGEDVARRGRLVERVEVDARRASLDEPEALDRRVHDTDLVDPLGLLLVALELLRERRGNGGSAHLREALDLVDVRDR